MTPAARNAFEWRVSRRFPRGACAVPDGLADRGQADGIESCTLDEDEIAVVYDLRATTLEHVIRAIGFATAGLSFAARLRWAVARHRDAVRAEDLKYVGGWDNIVREIYVSHYRRREHGRRDYRRRQWRQYEERRAQPREVPNAPEENDDG